MSDPLLDELRQHFRTSARERFATMRQSLDALERDLGDRDALQRLSRDFHALAGMGGTYGFPRVSELGDEAEESILPVVRGAVPLTPEHLARWRELLVALERDVAGAG